MSLYTLMVSLSNHEPVLGSSFDKLRTSGLQKREVGRCTIRDVDLAAPRSTCQ
jgi:hypothetical protein